MTDRELLELAAKAAEIELWHEDVFVHGLTRKVTKSGILQWNPLTNDGDALRLAVKLRLSHLWQHDWVMVYKGDDSVREHDLSDPCAATRRAIVRAAAEIGRAMK